MKLLFGLILVFILAGCATTAKESMLNAQISNLQSRVQALESELKKTQDEKLALQNENLALQEENVILKGKIIEVKKTPIKMPTAKDIQTALKNAGFYQGELDGKIGPKTKEAIKKFQEANGLNPDGVVGSKTWNILVKYLEGKP